ncbi:uncharacterized protein LOC120263234 [Dioscorea cayenensis subsp. rotundata]|uniref:Uncharacterized protein LOC120263234 n=1 Tax=Dioscorea cayennensis subsp. rotundata TaxID=55577 RepID=A0AB40BI74_DIOCR|nr:uncharacterized protein LOC120263234 [Dioscorea cayenensis subsp. rotundata]
MTVASYYAKMKTILDQLGAYSKVPKCNCGGCTCGQAREYACEREEEKLHQFLMGKKVTVLISDNKKSMSRWWRLPLKWQNRKQQHHPLTDNSKAVAKENDIVPIATNEDTRYLIVFEVIGYPPWWMGPHGWENQPNQKNQALPRGGAFPGNNKSRNQGRVTALHTVGRPSTTGDHSDGNSMTLNLMGDQVQRLLTFLEHENSEWLSSKVLDEFFWILDSGASNNMTGTFPFDEHTSLRSPKVTFISCRVGGDISDDVVNDEIEDEEGTSSELRGSIPLETNAPNLEGNPVESASDLNGAISNDGGKLILEVGRHLTAIESRPRRVTKMPAKYEDYVVFLATLQPSRHVKRNHGADKLEFRKPTASEKIPARSWEQQKCPREKLDRNHEDGSFVNSEHQVFGESLKERRRHQICLSTVHHGTTDPPTRSPHFMIASQGTIISNEERRSYDEAIKTLDGVKQWRKRLRHFRRIAPGP